jgi:SecD/SecF fusion protein
LSSSKVGATIASDIRDSALQAIIASLLAIFGYILIRFRKWQFGLGAVVALFHDVLIVISCVAIARAFGFIIEVDQVFIAAVLTIIGYSINDTVVVFDRVRETLADSNIKSREDITNTLNEAVNSTFSRTFITGITTFLVVFVLFIAGGEVLRGFSFALILGIIFGTYSSVFVASSIVNDTLKPEEFAQAEQPATQKPKSGKKVAGAGTV